MYKRQVDTSPLHGMPLEELDLDATSVSDQDPLAGLPLRLSLIHISEPTRPY